jgi:hypothetical protein
VRHPAAVSVWYGVVFSRLGRGDLAWRTWDRIRLPALQPWIAAERGRVLRELGLHAAAESLEWPALLVADDPVDEAMLRVSLTADAVGFGDLARAQRRLATAREAVAVARDGPRAARQLLRLAWVEVEVAFLTGGDPPSERLPRWDDRIDAPWYPPEHAWGSRFHTAKGLLFGGIVHDDLRLLGVAALLAPPVLAWGVHLARADAGEPGALEAARTAWRAMVPPPQHADAALATPTARRLAG